VIESMGFNKPIPLLGEPVPPWREVRGGFA
jgi:hypothetical protein